MVIPAVIPAVAKALPWIATALFGAGTLWSAHNESKSNRILEEGNRSQRELNTRQIADYERWLSDYKRNTGVDVRYKYLGTSGALETERLQSDLLSNQSRVNMYNRHNVYANLMRSGGFMSGFASRHYKRGSPWREPGVGRVSRDPMYG